jgi:hypothetical protein
MMFSATVRFSQRFTSWYTVLTPCARASAGPVNRRSTPSTRIVPAVGEWIPVRALIRVDLPAPFSPIRAWISPGRRLKSTPSRAFTGGNSTLMPVISTTGGAVCWVILDLLVWRVAALEGYVAPSPK